MKYIKIRYSQLMLLAIILVLLFSATIVSCNDVPDKNSQTADYSNREGSEVNSNIVLPEPNKDGKLSVEEAIDKRISRRDFLEEPLSKESIAQILWAAQGISVDNVTGATRTAPSAGATYPIEIYLVAGEVENIPEGIYHYKYQKHELHAVAEGDSREELSAAALGQDFIASAPASIVLAADYDRTTGRYGDRGVKYVHMEIGHITQNIYLQAEALNMGTVAVGAFTDKKVQQLLKSQYEPLMITPIGKK